jgi:hypothetical protein
VATALSALTEAPISFFADMRLREPNLTDLAHAEPDTFGVLWILQQVGTAAGLDCNFPHYFAETGWEYAEKSETRGLGTIISKSAERGAVACFQEGKYKSGWIELIISADAARYNAFSCYMRDPQQISFEIHTRLWTAHGGVGSFNPGSPWLRTLVPIGRIYNEATRLHRPQDDRKPIMQVSL